MGPKVKEEAVDWDPKQQGCWVEPGHLQAPGLSLLEWLGLQVLGVLETSQCARGPRALTVTSVWDSCAYCVPLGIGPGPLPRPALVSPWGVALPAGSEF